MHPGSILMAAALLGAGLQPAAAAWEGGGYWDEWGEEAWAEVRDMTGVATLEVECYWDDFGDEAAILILTGERYEETTSYAAEVPLTFFIDGAAYGPLPARFARSGDELVVAHRIYDYSGSEPIFDVLDGIAEAQGPITASYFNSEWTFPHEGADDAMDEVLWCLFF